MAKLGVNECDFGKVRDRVKQSQVSGGAICIKVCANMDCNKHGSNKCSICKYKMSTTRDSYKAIEIP